MFSNAVCTYEANLTQDRVVQISSPWADQLGLSPGCGYSQLVGTAVNLLGAPPTTARRCLKNSTGRLC